MMLMRSCVERWFRRVCPVVLVVSVLASASPVGAGQDSGGSPLDTIAIVPFANLTGDAADDWIGAGIAESLATGLPGSYMVIARGRVSETANDANRGGGTAAPA